MFGIYTLSNTSNNLLVDAGILFQTTVFLYTEFQTIHVLSQSMAANNHGIQSHNYRDNH